MTFNFIYDQDAIAKDNPQFINLGNWNPRPSKSVSGRVSKYRGTSLTAPSQSSGGAAAYGVTLPALSAAVPPAVRFRGAAAYETTGQDSAHTVINRCLISPNDSLAAANSLQ